MRTVDVNAFLRRLGVDAIEPTSVGGLHRLHRAFVERIPYEVIDIQLERPTTLELFEASDRIVRRRRGGYCFHLNGAFSVLLAALGYRIVLHRAGVQNHTEPRAGIYRNHLALTVDGYAFPRRLQDDGHVGAGQGARFHVLRLVSVRRARHLDAQTATASGTERTTSAHHPSAHHAAPTSSSQVSGAKGSEFERPGLVAERPVTTIRM